MWYDAVRKVKMNFKIKFPPGSGPKPGKNCRCSKEDGRPDPPREGGTKIQIKSALKYSWDGTHNFLEHLVGFESPPGRGPDKQSRILNV
jgi:hypothetical protein